MEEKARYGDREILKSTRRREGEKRIAIVASAISILRLFLRLAFGMERVGEGRYIGDGLPVEKKKRRKRNERLVVAERDASRLTP